MQIQVVTFSEAKAGNAPAEGQDGASGGVAGDGTGTARFIVVDGATGAYAPLRWVDQLVSSFAPPAGAPRGPRLEPAAMRAWFGRMQDQWGADVRAFDSIIEERKFGACRTSGAPTCGPSTASSRSASSPRSAR